MMDSSNSSESSFSGEQPSLRRSLSSPSRRGGGSTAAECCGGTTADCAAVCCCPCSVVSLVVLAVYKVPRGLCRRIRRGRLGKKDGSEIGGSERKMSKAGSSQFAVHPLQGRDEDDFDEEEEDEAEIELENEMWNKFNSGGFWRSHSQAETASSLKTD